MRREKPKGTVMPSASDAQWALQDAWRSQPGCAEGKQECLEARLVHHRGSGPAIEAPGTVAADEADAHRSAIRSAPGITPLEAITTYRLWCRSGEFLEVHLPAAERSPIQACQHGPMKCIEKVRQCERGHPAISLLGIADSRPLKWLAWWASNGGSDPIPS